MTDTPKQWSGHAPDLVRDNRMMHEHIAEQDREIQRLRAAMARVVRMLDLAAGTHGSEAANPRHQAAQALLIIHGALRGADELHQGEGDNRVVSTERRRSAAAVSGTPESYSCSDPRQDARTSAGDRAPSPVLHADETFGCISEKK